MIDWSLIAEIELCIIIFLVSAIISFLISFR
jgi:hypothetical protein